MKIRKYEDIAFEDNGDNTVTFRHLIGEMVVPNSGGGYVLSTGCGVGKSTSIASLINLFTDDGFALFENSRSQCNEAKQRLINMGVCTSDILVIHSCSKEYEKLINNPECVTQFRVLILPSIHLYTSFLPALFAYNKGNIVDINSYIGDVCKLFKSTLVRRFILIDEAPNFIQPFAEFCGLEITNSLGTYLTKKCRDSVKLTNGRYLKSLGLPFMEELYFSRMRMTSSRFFQTDTPFSRLKAREVLSYIHRTFMDIYNKTRVEIFHNLNDLIVDGSKCNIYLFDATGSILSDYKRSNFKLIENNQKNYSSPMTFEEFPMMIDRWKYKSRASLHTIDYEIEHMADILESQIKSIKGNLLIVTWMYMSLKSSNPEMEAEKVDTLTELDKRLQSRSLSGRYSIIYRGSKDDKATNKFSTYEGITFLGDWKTGTKTTKLINKNLGINSSEIKHRVASIVQTICRIRIRNHDGEPIKVFYSSDIDEELMANVFRHFVENSDKGVKIEGIPLYQPDCREFKQIEKLRILCEYDSSLFSSIQNCKSYTLRIPFDDMFALLPMKERRRRAYNRFCDWLLSEYNISLTIT